MGELILIRHGETEWSRTGRHAGRTDVPLTAAGEAAARALAPALAARHIVASFTSPASRAGLTARIAGLGGAEPDPDLWEWDYGGYEGLTGPRSGSSGQAGTCGATASLLATPAIPARRSPRLASGSTRC